MQNNPSFTRGGKRFIGNIEDTEQSRVRHKTNTPERFNEGPKEPFTLLLDSTHLGRIFQLEVAREAL